MSTSTEKDRNQLDMILPLPHRTELSVAVSQSFKYTLIQWTNQKKKKKKKENIVRAIAYQWSAKVGRMERGFPLAHSEHNAPFVFGHWYILF